MENFDDLKTLSEMAALLHIHSSTLRSWAKARMVSYYRIGKKYFFKPEEILKKSAFGLNINHNGLSISNGYVQIKIGKHPMANKNGYIPLHRLIMQAKIGRPLQEGEIVHPKNGNTLDFKIDNLEIVESLGKHNSQKKSMREDNT